MSRTQFVDDGLKLFSGLVEGDTAVSIDNTIRVQRLHESALLTADLIVHSQPQPAQGGKSLGDLARLISQTYSTEERILLSVDLSLDDENLAGDTHIGKSLSLVQYMRRRGRLSELIDICSRQRPQADWPQVEQIALPFFVAKDNLAIVINLASRFDIALDVPRYLDEKRRLDFNFLYFQNPNEGRHIPKTADWNAFLSVFAKALKLANDIVPFKQAHIFVSGSGAILFGMGCMWGSVKPAICYHFEDSSYYPLITINKKQHG